MPGKKKKNASDQIPFCEDQGMPNLTAAAKSGVAMQHLPVWPMPSGGVLVFEDQGLVDMDIANGVYSVIIHNHTDAADEGTCLEAVRLNTQLTISGPDDDDVLDVVVIGTLKGQLS